MLFGFESLACDKPNIINEFQPDKHVGPEPCRRKDQFWLWEQRELEPDIGIRCGSWGWGGGQSKGHLGVWQGMLVGLVGDTAEFTGGTLGSALHSQAGHVGVMQ